VRQFLEDLRIRSLQFSNRTAWDFSTLPWKIMWKSGKLLW